MARTKVDEWSTTADANTDVAGVDIGERCLAKNLNDAQRAIMAQIRATPLRESVSDMRDALSVYSKAEVDAVFPLQNPTPISAGGTGSTTADGARAALAAVVRVDTRAALKALDTTKDTTAILKLAGSEGTFVWKSGDYSTQIAADTIGGIYLKADAIASTVGAWVREYSGPADIKWWNPTGNGVADDLAVFQCAYNTLGNDAFLNISKPAVSYTLTANVTVAGNKRIYYMVDADVIWTTPSDCIRAMAGEQTNSVGNLWHRHEHYTDFRASSGGLLHTSARRGVTGSATGYQWDAHRIHVVNADPCSGPSWDGVGATNINRGVVGQALFSYIAAGNLYGSLWGQNIYTYVPAGADGATRGLEINVHVDTAVAPSVEITDNRNKLGLLITAKEKTATAGVYVGKGGGDGFYKGFISTQDTYPVHADSRFIELTDLFEVMRDGTTLIGKGTNLNFDQGIRLLPTGEVGVTTTGGPSTLRMSRTGNITGTAAVGNIIGSGLNSVGTSTNFNAITMVAVDGTNGSEDGRIDVGNYINGAYVGNRASFGAGFYMAGATGGDKGAGTINATAVYDDNVLLTCYVFDQYLDGKVDLAKWDAKVPNRILRGEAEKVVPLTEIVEEEVKRIEVRDGAAVLVTETVQVERPVTKQLPVLDENGEQVFRVEQVKKTLPVLNADGSPVMETVVYETAVPGLDADGNQEINADGSLRFDIVKREEKMLKTVDHFDEVKVPQFYTHTETVTVPATDDDEIERIHDPLRKFLEKVGPNGSGEYNPLDPRKFVKHFRDKRHLTSLPNETKFNPLENMPVGSWVQRFIELHEIEAVHKDVMLKESDALKAAVEKLLAENDKLHERIKALEAKAGA